MGRIYLFGGRNGENNCMLEEIEEYDASLDQWTVVKLPISSLWNPVEVCAVIAISQKELLVFGGSDTSIKDSATSYVFDASTSTLSKIGDLEKAQVFVSAPFLYGNFVYAVGNEYYVKSRNLNRFNLRTREWELVF